MVTIAPQNILRDLGDGLILRSATPEDAEELATLNSEIHRHPDAPEPEQGAAAYTRDLLTRPHPTLQASDFTVVQDTRSGRIVSTLCLIPQTWSYAGIPFGVGRPELVGTLPEYRRRGLVRAQFGVVHRWSAARGHLVQGITGIPNYYRQFGYEMTVPLDGGRTGYRSHIPKLKEGEAEPFRFRPAQVADVPFITQLYAHACQRYLLTCVRDEAIFRLELVGRSEQSDVRGEYRIIESAAGEAVGILIHAPRLRHGNLGAWAYELAVGVSWLAVTPSVFRYLGATGEAYAAQDPKVTFESIGFWISDEHPVYQVARSRLPNVRPPYAWYVRVADVPGFLRHIAPVLEQRLSASIAPGHTGELKLSFYRGGVKLAFQEGRIAEVSAWEASREKPGDAAFPGLSFLQLLFGHRTQEQLREVYPDCWVASDDARVLLSALFPRQPSVVWGVQ
jgi:hypothetical protein